MKTITNDERIIAIKEAIINSRKVKENKEEVNYWLEKNIVLQIKDIKESRILYYSFKHSLKEEQKIIIANIISETAKVMGIKISREI